MNRPSSGPVLAVMAIICAGCATTKDQPSGEFLSPISDETADLVGQVRFGLPLHDSVVLYQYLEQETPAVDEWTVIWDDLTIALIAMVEYSVEMVDLVQTDSSSAAIEQMIDLIRTLHTAVLSVPSAQPLMREHDPDAVVAAMRQEDSVTAAFRLALPEIDIISGVVRDLITIADEKLTLAVREINQKVDDRHASIRGYADNLAARRASVLRLLDLTDRAWTGDESAWQEMLASDWALRSDLGKDAALSPKSLGKAEKELIKRLAATAEIRGHLEPAYRDYQDQLNELYSIEDDMEATLRVAYLIIEGWDKAQRQLAAGEKTSFFKFTTSLMALTYRKAVD